MARPIFSLSLKSLGVFRIALACSALLDLFTRIRGNNLVAFQTDLGIFPRSAMTSNFFWEVLNPYFWSGEASVIAIIFGIHALVLILFLIGFKTRFFAVLSWFFELSLQLRNPAIIHIGDTYLRVFLLLSVFLPVQAAFSFDGRKNSLEEDEYRSPLTVVFVLQVFSIYFFSGLVKLMEPLWREGFGVYYALSSLEFTTQFGFELLKNPSLVKALNYCTLSLELCSPFFLFVGSKKSPSGRYVFFAAIFILHGALFLSMGVDSIQCMGLVVATALIPSSIWRKSKRVGFPIIEKKIYQRGVAAALLILLVTFNIRSAIVRFTPKAYGWFSFTQNAIFQSFGLNQNWGAFSRPVLRGQLRLVATLNDGTTLDWFRKAPFTIPETQTSAPITQLNQIWEPLLEEVNLPLQHEVYVASSLKDNEFPLIPDVHWARFTMALQPRVEPNLVLPFLRFKCWEENGRASDGLLRSLELFYHTQDITKKDKVLSLGRQDCVFQSK